MSYDVPSAYRRMPRPARACLLACLVLVAVFGAGCATTEPRADLFFETPALPPEVAQTAPPLNVAEMERALHYAVNVVRQTHGLPALAWAEPVARVARSHSRDMAESNFFGHTNLRGEDPSQRAARLIEKYGDRNASYPVQGLGENLFATHRYVDYTVRHSLRAADRYEVKWKDADQIVAEAVEAWLHSPRHRANVLSDVYGAQAIGVVLGYETIFVTQNLIARRDAALYAEGRPDR